MGWLYLGGIVLFAVVVLVLQSFSAEDDPPPDSDAEPREYRWGDELHEFSYRHPWDDEI